MADITYREAAALAFWAGEVAVLVGLCAWLGWHASLVAIGAQLVWLGWDSRR